MSALINGSFRLDDGRTTNTASETFLIRRRVGA
jgi:hypothetical protein